MTSLRRLLGETVFLPAVSSRMNRIGTHIAPWSKILDLGCGTCMNAKFLRGKGHAVTAVDIADTSYYEDIRPMLYDGEHLDFSDRSFDVCMLMAVLHHAKKPDMVLREALRVARTVIVLEDLVESPLQEMYTHLIDRVLNKEWKKPVHNNKTDNGWKRTFHSVNASLIYTHCSRVFLFMRHGLYILKNNA